MKVKEYMRLGKISIKARKKSTKNTVTGISFGLIMLIPIIFFTLAFYIGINNVVNETKGISTFNYFSRTDYDNNPASVSIKDNVYDDFAILDNKALKSLANEHEVSEVLRSEYFELNGIINNYNCGLTATITDENGNSVNYLPKENQNNNGNYYSGRDNLMKVIHTDDDNKYVLDGEISDFDQKTGSSNIFLCGEGFTPAIHGKTEVLVGENFAEKFDIEPNSLANKKLSLSFTFNGNNINSESMQYFVYDKDESSEGNNNSLKTIKFMQDFVIKGVIKKDFFNMASTSGDALIWLTDESVFLDADYNRIAPSINFQAEDDMQSAKYIVKYDEGISQMESRAKDNGVIIQAMGAMGITTFEGSYYMQHMNQTNNTVLPIMNYEFMLKDYKSATNFSSKLDAKISTILPVYASNNASYLQNFYTNSAYSDLSMLNTIGGYLMLVLYIFGGIIFFTTMLNLFNTVNYSVQARKNYMGVMRAIGAKQSIIPKLYFYEIILIFLKSLPWVLTFSAGVSLGIKLLIDLVMDYSAKILGVSISLNFGFYFLALGIMVLVGFGIAVLFSRIACKNVSKKPILEVLSDEK